MSQMQSFTSRDIDQAKQRLIGKKIVDIEHFWYQWYFRLDDGSEFHTTSHQEHGEVKEYISMTLPKKG